MAFDADQFGDNLDRFNSVLGAMRTNADAVIASMVKEQLRREAAIKLGDNELKQLQKQLDLDDKAFKQKVDQLEKEARSYKNQEERNKAVVEGINKLVTGLGQFASAGISATQSLYNSDKAFTSVAPTLDMMGGAIKSVSAALASLTSGIPILGQIGAFANATVQAVTDIAIQATKAQLENAQKMVDNFSKLASAGVAFGGSLSTANKAAHDAGVSLQTYTGFVTKNIEALSQLSGGAAAGAERVGAMTKSIADNNPKLLAMYGSMDSLMEASTTYQGFLASFGLDLTKNQKAVAASATNFMYSFKELQELTGQSAETLKKEQEERMKSAAYQAALRDVARTDIDAARRIDNAVSDIRHRYGEKAAAYAQEYFALGGKVISESSLQFGAVNRVMTQEFIPAVMQAQRLPEEEAKRQQAKLITSYQPVFENIADQRRGLQQINMAVKDGYTDIVNSTDAAVYASSNKNMKMVDAAEEQLKNRQKPLEEGVDVTAKVIKALNQFQIDLDRLTEKHLPKTGDLVEKLITVATKTTGMVDMMGTATEKFVEAMDWLGDHFDLKKTPGTSAGEQRAATAETIAREEGAGAIAAWGAGLKAKAGVGTLAPVTEEMTSAGRTQAAKAGLKVKEGATDAGEIQDTRTIKAAQAVQAAFGEKFGRFTSFKDLYHRGYPGSDHNQGLAFDFTLAKPPETEEEAQYYKDQIKRIIEENKDLKGSVRYIGEEYFKDKTGRTTGGHYHVSLNKMAKGGIASEPVIAGEAGPEAIIPLPDGRTVPVKVDNSALIDKLEEMIGVLKEQRDISEKQLWAVS